MQSLQRLGRLQQQARPQRHAAPSSRPTCRSRASLTVRANATSTDPSSKTVITKGPGTKSEALPFPWSEKDPYKLPIAIDGLQKMLLVKGWEKPWVEQIVDRLMKNMLRTTEERAASVISFLTGLGLAQDEVCNMASISVVLLGLNPETRLKPVVDYLKARGVPEASVPDLVLKHPRIFEYKVNSDAKYLEKGKARIQVDVVPLPNGTSAVGVNYFREGASFLASPVSPVGPLNMP